MRFIPSRIVNQRSGVEVAHTVLAADTFLSRLRGLIAQPPLAAGCALWISPCNQIHTHFLGYAIDAVFLSPDWRVLQVKEGIAPWRILPRVAGSVSVLEFCGLRANAIAPGDQLQLIQTGQARSEVGAARS